MTYIVGNFDKFITGIFEKKTEAIKWLIRSKDIDRNFQILKVMKFPFYILESGTDKRIFYFRKYKDFNLLDHKIHTVYHITEPWKSSQPGIDEMGYLDHDHISPEDE